MNGAIVMKVLEVDQWTSTGNIKDFSMSEWEGGMAMPKISGGDSAAAKCIFGGHFRIKEVNELLRPSIGKVWYKEGEGGKLELYKSNYDSSGQMAEFTLVMWQVRILHNPLVIHAKEQIMLKEFIITGEEILPDGVKVLITSCNDFNHYDNLPAIVAYDRYLYGKTGWNSDKCVAYYRDDAKIALAQ